jgi:hypothetical protein
MAEVKSIPLCKYILESEVVNLSREDKIKLLTKVAKTNMECIFTSGEGTSIRLDPLPDKVIYSLYEMVKKMLKL